MIFREITHLRQQSVTSADAVDLTDHDFAMRYTTSGHVMKCGANEIPTFFANSSCEAESSLSVVTVQPMRCSLRISGNIQTGDKVAVNASAHFCASDTAQSAVLASKDFAIALESGTDTYIDVDVVRGI